MGCDGETRTGPVGNESDIDESRERDRWVSRAGQVGGESGAGGRWGKLPYVRNRPGVGDDGRGQWKCAKAHLDLRFGLVVLRCKQ